jgi:putative intracellular protease/amidase
VAEIIRDFFHAGKPIAAPCMGLAVVIEALADLLPWSLILSPESPQGPVAVYSALRLVTTHRPLIGRSPGEVSNALAQVVTGLERLLSSC